MSSNIRSGESAIPFDRWSGVPAKLSPPSETTAWPPKTEATSTTVTRAPPVAASSAVASPPGPAPTTTTSGPCAVTPDIAATSARNAIQPTALGADMAPSLSQVAGGARRGLWLACPPPVR